MKMILIFAVTLISTFAAAQTINPVIKNYGAMYEVPFATDRPDPSLVYKIVVETSLKIDNPKEIYSPLDHIARMYNLHVFGGVPQKNLHVAVVIFATGIDVVMNNDAYKKKYGVDNPNTPIINEMKEAGIEFYACGQSIMNFKVDPKTVNPNIAIALSRFTTVSKLQLNGYAMFKY